MAHEPQNISIQVRKDLRHKERCTYIKMLSFQGNHYNSKDIYSTMGILLLLFQENDIDAMITDNWYQLEITKIIVIMRKSSITIELFFEHSWYPSVL